MSTGRLEGVRQSGLDNYDGSNMEDVLESRLLHWFNFEHTHRTAQEASAAEPSLPVIIHAWGLLQKTMSEDEFGECK